MAGHSKWSNIKHRKARADAKKGKIFSAIMREVVSAITTGGADPKTNIRLKTAISKAKKENIPISNIDRYIKKVTGGEKIEFFDVSYEAYGFGGVGIIIEGTVDNRNRSASEFRSVVVNKGGTVAEPGAVSFNFDKKGIISINKSKSDENTIFSISSDNGAEDFQDNDEEFIVICDPTSIVGIVKAFEKHGIVDLSNEIVSMPKMEIDVSDDDLQKNNKIIDSLYDLDFVENVFHNMSVH